MLIAAAIALPAHAENEKAAPTVEIGADLAFGIVSAGEAQGQVEVLPAGAQRCSGAVICLGGQRPGLVYVTGRKDYIVSIVLGNAELSNGKNHLTARLSPSDAFLVLEPGHGKNRFTVGGTLTLDARQAEGAYSGTYDLIVEYQ